MQTETFNSRSPLLKIEKLSTYFDTHSGLVKAVDGVDIKLYPGECLGVVGESGSGKSVTFLSVMGLIKKPGRIASGTIDFDGRELTSLNPRQYLCRQTLKIYLDRCTVFALPGVFCGIICGDSF